MISNTQTPAELGRQIFCEKLQTTPVPKEYLDQKIKRKKINPKDVDFLPKENQTFSRMGYLVKIYCSANPGVPIKKIKAHLKKHFFYNEKLQIEIDFKDSHRFPKNHFKSLEDKKEINQITKYKTPNIKDSFTENGVIRAHKQNYKKISATVFANEEYIGGHGFPSGQRTHEEMMLIHTNARAFMPVSLHTRWNSEDNFRSAGHYTGEEIEPRSAKTKKACAPDFGFRIFGGGYSLHNKDLVLLANGAGKIQQPIPFVPIFVAAPQRDEYEESENPTLYLQHLAGTINAQYDLATQSASLEESKEESHKLITGALGCGFFRNSPYIVAYLQILLLQKNEYKDLDVDFCIPKSFLEKKNKNSNQIDFTQLPETERNHSVFKFIITHFQELSEEPSFQIINKIIAEGKYSVDSTLVRLEEDCQTTVNSLFQKKQSDKLISTDAEEIGLADDELPIDLSNIADDEDDEDEEDNQHRICKNGDPEESRGIFLCSLFLKMISATAVTGGILLLMVLHSPLAIAAGGISLGIGLTLFGISKKIKEDPLAMPKESSTLSPLP